MEQFKYLGAVEVFLMTYDQNQVLLLKRSPHRRYLPNYVAGLGGKMDLNHLETPLETAYREIYEESHIEKSDIVSLNLKGIITANDKFGKWFVYEFVGILNKDFDFDKIVQTDEGVIFFEDISKLNTLNLIPDLKDNFLKNLLTDNYFYWVKSFFDNNNKLLKKNVDKL